MLVVNGRFLANQFPLGAHRAARGFLGGLMTAGVELEVVVPTGTAVEFPHRELRSPPGAAGLQVWEQSLLPAVTGRRPLLSLANTGPILVRRQAVYVFDIATAVGPQWFLGFNNAYMRVMMRVAQRSTLVMTSSEHVRDQLGSRGVARERLAVVPPAVDERFAPASPAEIDDVRRRLGLPRAYVLHLGWGDPRKDAATAVAAHLSARRTTEHDLVLLGTPHPYFTRVTLPDEPSVRVLGRVPDTDLVPLISGAAALLYPSLYEGFGLPPLEAVACGTPAVVSDIPVLRETIGRRATFAAPGDVRAWADAILEGLAGRLPLAQASPWTWSQAGAALAATLDRFGMR